MTVVFDSDPLPARERLDALQAAYGGQSPPRGVRVDVHPLRHRVERVDLGPEVHLLRTGGSALEILRTARHVRSDAPEYLAIGFHRRGDGLVATDGVVTGLDVGHLNGVDLTRPYRVTHRTANTHDVLVLSNRQVGVPVDVVRRAAPALAGSPLYDLVRQHVAGLFDTTQALPVGPRLAVGRATTELVRALLTTAAESPDSAEALHESLPARIALYLETHLGDRDLSVEKVAAAHHVSVRHVYGVWARAGHDRTPLQWVMSRRLLRARELLVTTDPTRSIEAVARQCGFADSSHFSRRFREAFGVSPREWRAASARGGGVAPDWQAARS